MSETSGNNDYDLVFLGDGSYPDGWEVTPGFEVLYHSTVIEGLHG